MENLRIAEKKTWYMLKKKNTRTDENFLNKFLSSENMANNEQRWLHEAKRLEHIKETSQQNKERAYRTGRNFCQLYIWQKINIYNI